MKVDNVMFVISLVIIVSIIGLIVFIPPYIGFWAVGVLLVGLVSLFACVAQSNVRLYPEYKRVWMRQFWFSCAVIMGISVIEVSGFYWWLYS